MTDLGWREPVPADRLADYFPGWLNNLADDVTIEGSMMDGVVQGADDTRTVLVTIRKLYDTQRFHFAGPYGEDGFIEDYAATVDGEPLDNFTVVTSNAAGKAQHVVGNYRPRSSVLLLSRLVGERLAGTPMAEHFLRGE